MVSHRATHELTHLQLEYSFSTDVQKQCKPSKFVRRRYHWAGGRVEVKVYIGSMINAENFQIQISKFWRAKKHPESNENGIQYKKYFSEIDVTWLMTPMPQ
jgi:hypothetical protein